MNSIVIKILLIIMCFLTTVHGQNYLFANQFLGKFKKLRISSKKFTTEEINDEKYLEYPKNNKEFRQRINEKWEIYYKCLQQSNEKKPEIRHLLEGQYTELECDVCRRPFEYQENLEWKYKPLSTDVNIVEPQHLDLAPGMLITDQNTLKIFNAVKDFEGLYVCFKGRDPVSVYILEISKNDTMEKTNMFYEDPKVVNIEGIILQSYIRWEKWTECNSCGVVGRKYKFGTCMISLKKANTYRVHARNGQNLVSTNGNIKKNEIESNLKPLKNSTSQSTENLNLEVNIIQKFETGIPCTSQYMPKGILDMFKNLNKALKVVVKFCLVDCPESEIFEVLDSAGKVVEIANNSAGIYSVFQKIPELPPDIERRSITEELGKDIIIPCPGTTLSNTPVTWKINKKIIFPEVIANESDGRFTVDLLNRIHIKKLRLKDSHIYSCWQRDKLVGTIHLHVNKHFKIGSDRHITLIGMLVVIGTFVLIGGKILFKELKMLKLKT